MENKLNIQITVTDEQMCSLLRGSLESLPDEKIQEIFGNALIEFFKTEDGKKLFCEKSYYGSTPKPTTLLVKMVENAVSKDLLKPYVDKMVNMLEDNYVGILKAAMIETFSTMFFSEMQKSTLQCTLSQMASAIDQKEDKR